MTDMKFDEFTLTSILSKLEESNHMVIASRDSYSILMGYHYILLGITDGLWDQLELF